MDKIVCLVGESGSGKSTIAELLEKEGYNYIQSYTTRKPRFLGEKGHIFVDDEVLLRDFKTEDNKLVPKENIIAYTYFGGAHYWATKEQYIDKGTSVYIIDPVGVKELKEKIKDAEITAVYLKVDRNERFARMKHRAEETNPSEISKKTITISDIEKRLNYDKEAFKIVQCDYVVDGNREIKEIIRDINSLIKNS